MLAKFRGNVKLAADAVIKTENGKTFMVMNCEGVENRNGQDNVSCYELVYYNEENAKKMQPHLKKGVLINVSDRGQGCIYHVCGLCV